MIPFTPENKTLFLLSGGFCTHCGGKGIESSNLKKIPDHCETCWDSLLTEICKEWSNWITQLNET